MSRIRIAVQSILALLVGVCASCSDTTNVPKECFRVVEQWQSPEESEYVRDDGEAPFPPGWPAVAMVVKTKEVEDSHATLCLLAGRGLNANNAVSRFVESIRFADVCKDADLRGKWVWLCGGSPSFVLVYHSGGTAGLTVEVFGRDVIYDRTHESQLHSFARILSTHSKGSPFVGDIDGDGFSEVLTRDSPGKDGEYTIWGRRDGGDLVEVGKVGRDQIKEYSNLDSL